MPGTLHDTTMLSAKFLMEHDKESGHVKEWVGVRGGTGVTKYSTVRLQYHFE